MVYLLLTKRRIVIPRPRRGGGGGRIKGERGRIEERRGEGRGEGGK